MEIATQYDLIHEKLMQLEEFDLAFEVLKAKRIKLETEFALRQDRDGYNSDQTIDGSIDQRI